MGPSPETVSLSRVVVVEWFHLSGPGTRSVETEVGEGSTHWTRSMNRKGMDVREGDDFTSEMECRVTLIIVCRRSHASSQSTRLSRRFPLIPSVVEVLIPIRDRLRCGFRRKLWNSIHTLPNLHFLTVFITYL